MELRNPAAKVTIVNIPYSFPDLVGTDKYILLGVIRYTGPFPNKSYEINKENNALGHYTAICRRQNTWYEINDIPAQMRKLSPKDLIMFVGLIIYLKISE